MNQIEIKLGEPPRKIAGRGTLLQVTMEKAPSEGDVVLFWGKRYEVTSVETYMKLSYPVQQSGEYGLLVKELD